MDEQGSAVSAQQSGYYPVLAPLLLLHTTTLSPTGGARSPIRGATDRRCQAAADSARSAQRSWSRQSPSTIR
jgi:hypothetical protein